MPYPLAASQGSLLMPGSLIGTWTVPVMVSTLSGSTMILFPTLPLPAVKGSPKTFTIKFLKQFINFQSRLSGTAEACRGGGVAGVAGWGGPMPLLLRTSAA